MKFGIRRKEGFTVIYQSIFKAKTKISVNFKCKVKGCAIFCNIFNLARPRLNLNLFDIKLIYIFFVYQIKILSIKGANFKHMVIIFRHDIKIIFVFYIIFHLKISSLCKGSYLHVNNFKKCLVKDLQNLPHCTLVSDIFISQVDIVI